MAKEFWIYHSYLLPG